jgi:hypothetical protein
MRAVEAVEVLLKLGVTLAALAWLASDREGAPSRLRRRLAQAGMALAALATAAHFDFGRLHGGGRFAHHWEQFHHFLGAKYFPELGYDGLYVASMGAQIQSDGRGALQPTMRDLRTDVVVATASLERHGAEVHHRFSRERWLEWLRDHRFYADLERGLLQAFRHDHGFNASPAWAWVARLVAADRRADDRTSTLLGLLDLLLLATAFTVLFLTYGSRLGILALIVWGTGYAWRFYWTGGAFLRQDWLAATLLAICMLHRRRFASAGALLAFAAAVRVFPALFFFGLLVQAGRDLVTRRSLGWAVRLAGGALVVGGALFAAGSHAGRGPQAWREFAGELRRHDASWLTNNVGLRLTVLYGPDTFRQRLVRHELAEPWVLWQEWMNEEAARRRWAIWGAAALLLLLAGRSALRSAPDEAAALGLVAVFALASVTCYYWGMVVLALLRRPRATAIALLALNALLAITHLLTPTFEIRYGVMSWGLLLFFVWWTPEQGFWRRGWERLRGAGQRRAAVASGSSSSRTLAKPRSTWIATGVRPSS